MSQSLDISQARREFNRLDERLETEPVILIRRHGKDAFAAVNIEYLSTILETLEVLADEDAGEALRASMEDIREGRLYDHEEIKREFL